MNLSVRTSFARRLGGLVNAANEGKGMSQLPYWELYSDDDDITAVSIAAAHGPKPDEDHSDANPDNEDADRRDAPHTHDGSQEPPNTTVLRQDAQCSQDYQRENSSNPEASKEAFLGAIDRQDEQATADRLELGVSKDSRNGTTNHENNREAANDGKVSTSDGTSATLNQAKEEDDEDDLIDYENADENPDHDTTGSLTLAGDEFATAVTGMTTIFSGSCCQSQICCCVLCSNLLTIDDSVETANDLPASTSTIELYESTSVNGAAEEDNAPLSMSEGLRSGGNDTTVLPGDLEQEHGKPHDGEEHDELYDEQNLQHGSTVQAGAYSEDPISELHESDLDRPVHQESTPTRYTYTEDSGHTPHTRDYHNLEHEVPSAWHVDIPDGYQEPEYGSIESNAQNVNSITAKSSDGFSQKNGNGSRGHHVINNIESASTVHQVSVRDDPIADDDVITYEEDEIDEAANIREDEHPSNGTALSLPKSSSTKRSRNINLETDALDDRSQGTAPDFPEMGRHDDANTQTDSKRIRAT